MFFSLFNPDRETGENQGWGVFVGVGVGVNSRRFAQHAQIPVFHPKHRRGGGRQMFSGLVVKACNLSSLVD